MQKKDMRRRTAELEAARVLIEQREAEQVQSLFIRSGRAARG